MNATICSLRQLEPNCKYYVVANARTREIVTVVEAEHEFEARQFYAALHHLLHASPESNIRVLESGLPPTGGPVFRRKYFQAMQVNAQDEARLFGVTQH